MCYVYNYTIQYSYLNARLIEYHTIFYIKKYFQNKYEEFVDVLSNSNAFHKSRISMILFVHKALIRV